MEYNRVPIWTAPVARPLRLQFAHTLYHVTRWTHARQAIVKTVADPQAFLNCLAQVVDRFEWRFHAYFLMNNHYHLLVETPSLNLSQGMRQLNGPYTQRLIGPWAHLRG